MNCPHCGEYGFELLALLGHLLTEHPQEAVALIDRALEEMPRTRISGAPWRPWHPGS